MLLLVTTSLISQFGITALTNLSNGAPTLPDRPSNLSVEAKLPSNASPVVGVSPIWQQMCDSRNHGHPTDVAITDPHLQHALGTLTWNLCRIRAGSDTTVIRPRVWQNVTGRSKIFETFDQSRRPYVRGLVISEILVPKPGEPIPLGCRDLTYGRVFVSWGSGNARRTIMAGTTRPGRGGQGRITLFWEDFPPSILHDAFRAGRFEYSFEVLGKRDPQMCRHLFNWGYLLAKERRSDGVGAGSVLAQSTTE